MDNIDKQLKELYDSLEEDDRLKKEKDEESKKNLLRMVETVSDIENLVDSYGIPRKRGDKILSLYERIDFALKKRGSA